MPKRQKMLYWDKSVTRMGQRLISPRRWSRRVVTTVVQKLGLTALMPFMPIIMMFLYPVIQMIVQTVVQSVVQAEVDKRIAEYEKKRKEQMMQVYRGIIAE